MLSSHADHGVIGRTSDIFLKAARMWPFEKLWGRPNGLTDRGSAGDTRAAVSRRGFLRAGSAGVVGLSLAERARAAQSSLRRLVWVQLTGGASTLETFDPKPDAPSRVRGPLRAIRTRIPGVAFSEGLPLLADRADQLTIVRSLFHTAAPIHETGHQLLFSGRLATLASHPPGFGSLVMQQAIGAGDWPADSAPASQSMTQLSGQLLAPYVVVGGVPQGCGLSAGSLGQLGGWLGPTCDPQQLFVDHVERSAIDRERFGDSRIGRLLAAVPKVLDQGARCVVVNLFSRLDQFGTFDSHGGPGSEATRVTDYRDVLCPALDRGLTALLDQLEETGALAETLVVVTGEFGRSPWVNEGGGRDHWPAVWSALVAGGYAPRGLVLGASDAHAGEPADHPIDARRLFEMATDWLGVAELSNTPPALVARD